MGSSLCTDTTGDSAAREEGQSRRRHKLYRHQSPRRRERVLRLRNRQGRFAWMESRTREPDSRETRSDPSWSVRGGLTSRTCFCPPHVCLTVSLPVRARDGSRQWEAFGGVRGRGGVRALRCGL